MASLPTVGKVSLFVLKFSHENRFAVLPCSDTNVHVSVV